MLSTELRCVANSRALGVDSLEILYYMWDDVFWKRQTLGSQVTEAVISFLATISTALERIFLMRRNIGGLRIISITGSAGVSLQVSKLYTTNS